MQGEEKLDTAVGYGELKSMEVMSLLCKKVLLVTVE
jgi:hypothetical protein